MTELENPEIYRAVLEGLQTGVYLVDRSRKILFWNEGAQRITGYLRQDVVGRFLRDQLFTAKGETTESSPIFVDPLQELFRDGKSSITRASILHKDGHRVPIVLRTIPIRNSHGSVIGAAESFDLNVSASGWARRQAALSEFGCLDEETGIPAKGFIQAHLRECLTIFAEHNVPFGILIVQVDQMDQLQARHGPGVIPAMLRATAQTLENSLSAIDLVGRLSARQFMVLLSECRETDIEKAAERLRTMVSRAEIEWWGEQISITCAFGGAACGREDTIESLIERAEKNLLESIAAGGNRVTVLA